jgi:hypothetical protein
MKQGVQISVENKKAKNIKVEGFELRKSCERWPVILHRFGKMFHNFLQMGESKGPIF